MKPEPYILYHVEDAELLSDGILRVPTGGSDGEILFTGIHDVPPANPDYGFWRWLTRRLKRRGLNSLPVSILDEPQIGWYRDDYRRECA